MSINNDFSIKFTVIEKPTYESDREIIITGSRKERDYQFLESRNLEMSPPVVGLEERLPVFVPATTALGEVEITSTSQLVTIDLLGPSGTYLFNWGDGTFTQEVAGNISHTYAVIGTYSFGLATDQDNPDVADEVTSWEIL